ncbi:Uncharacterised protein [Scardovia inopinata]|uniref:Uncharacterized protein n=1 Tax=Scardovia inopinata F0304 TaxID=641146 RepID=W5IGD9_SCAIO|nr:hypothetical protein [Scardovia inopinata]EFG25951.1 hypothetical protein HMPREF9020_01018 [Scardovia inopinata F0304]BAR07422.1 hypothetical protein SCIP_1355 [Scardovia inopinata JCM 12537]SUV51496.1 Uncharacterised protein [Scardovia inopinata]
MKRKELKEYKVTIILLSAAMIVLLIGLGVYLFFEWKLSQIAALPNDDVGGWSKLFGFPVLGVGSLVGCFLMWGSVPTFIAAGVSACIQVTHHKNKQQPNKQ